MVLKGLALVAVVALCCCGCSKGGDDNRAADLLPRQEEHARKIAQMSEKMDSVDEKLSGIEKGINALLGAGSATASTQGDGAAGTSSFANTDEYKDITRQIGVLEQQVAAVQGAFTGFQDEQRQTTEREALRDPRAAWRAMSQPEELTRRLDILAKNFSGKINDPATRNQFVADVEDLKGRYSAPLSPQEKQQQARSLIAAAIDEAQDDRARGWLERQLQSLDEAPNAEELAQRVDRTLQMQRMREIGEMTRKYNIPEDTVRDSGIVSFGRGGPGGFGPRRAR